MSFPSSQLSRTPAIFVSSQVLRLCDNPGPKAPTLLQLAAAGHRWPRLRALTVSGCWEKVRLKPKLAPHLSIDKFREEEKPLKGAKAEETNTEMLALQLEVVGAGLSTALGGDYLHMEGGEAVWNFIHMGAKVWPELRALEIPPLAVPEGEGVPAGANAMKLRTAEKAIEQEAADLEKLAYEVWPELHTMNFTVRIETI